MERCLACDAVVNKETPRANAFRCSALYRVQIEARPRLGQVRLERAIGVRVHKRRDTERRQRNSVPKHVPLLTTASQARQRSTAGDS